MPPLSLQPIRTSRAFEEILNQLEAAIVRGELSAGDRLPSERELAARFEVSRTSVREALRVLEALGLVSVRRGSEHGATLVEAPANAFAHLLRFHLGLRHLSVGQLVEFRVTVESWAIGAAAGRRDTAMLSELENLVRAMESDRLDQVEFHRLDVAFHVTLARASKNELVALVVEGCRTAIERAMLEATLQAKNWDELRDRLVQEHRAIYEAVRSGDASGASRLVSEHIQRVYKEHLLDTS